MDDGFTFAEVRPPLAAAVGPPPIYPIFGRPRSPPASLTPAAEGDSRRPLWRYLMVDQGPPPPPPATAAAAAEDDELDLDGEPPETAIPYMYCPLFPALPAATASASPARCRKSGSTGSSLLRWRQRSSISRSRSDGKERFVFLNTSSSFSGSGSDHHKGSRGGGEDALSYYANGGGGGRRRSFLPYRQDLVGIFAFRRSYHLF
uniref:Uncharacterized protein n=1 Tax=Leersia perrieri TaxID=77586 RepID=A0A0D9WJW5_9ORYZ